jgi:hypothetical protein
VHRPGVHAAILTLIGYFGHALVNGSVIGVAMLSAIAVASIAGGTAAVALLMFLGALLTMAALRVRVEPAHGVRLPRNLAPALHEVIDSLRGPLHASSFEEVLLGTRMEIATVRVPRIGGLRGHDDYLVIGLPLLLALPLEYVSALIAHEMAHHSRGGTVRGARLYGLREGWLQAARAASASQHPVAAMLAPFHRWFARSYAALSFDAACDHELAADRRAAQVTSRDDLAGALLRLQVVERFIVDRFHPGILADLRRYGVPPTGLCRRFEKALDTLRDDTHLRAWIDAAIDQEVPGNETHPPLRRRLSALAIGDVHAGGPRCLVEAAFSERFAGMSAARLCLAAIPESVMASIENAWADDLQNDLAERHEQLVRMDERRRELEGRTDLSPTEMLDHAIATAETDGPEHALPALRKLTDLCPDMAPARFVLGTLLLRANDKAGLAHIHAAVRLDPRLDEQGRELAIGFLRANDKANPGETSTIANRLGSQSTETAGRSA